MTADDAKSPVDQALDLFLYLPVGFVFELPRSIPRFIERGRRELHAAVPGSGERGALDPATRSLSRIPEQARGTLRALGVTGAAPTPRRAVRTGAAAESGTPGFEYTAPADDSSSSPASSSGNGSAKTAAVVDAIDADTLGVPGYDSLAASQVVPRLESLTADELELVRRYEQSNRGRKTILSKIAQLQAG